MVARHQMKSMRPKTRSNDGRRNAMKSARTCKHIVRRLRQDNLGEDYEEGNFSTIHRNYEMNMALHICVSSNDALDGQPLLIHSGITFRPRYPFPARHRVDRAAENDSDCTTAATDNTTVARRIISYNDYSDYIGYASVAAQAVKMTANFYS